MYKLESLLQLPLGKCLAEGNWESHVYELGEDWVYKEIKLPRSLDQGTQNYEMRLILQEFWNSNAHFHNMKRDYQVFKKNLGPSIPNTLFCVIPSLLDQTATVTISVQEKIIGQLLSDATFTPTGLSSFAKSIHVLCEKEFAAPADFHAGNLMIDNSGEINFFDTGTPSDWQYFLDEEKLMTSIEISRENALDFVNFMKPIFKSHWKRILEFANQ